MPRRGRPIDIDQRPRWAQWLVEQRELRGWLQREFAERIHVSQQSLSAYERGITRPTDEVAEQIAIAFNVPEAHVRENLGLYVPEEMLDDGEVIRLPPGRQLTARQRRMLYELIETFLADDDEQPPGGDIGPAGVEDGGHELEDLRPAASDR